MLKCELVPVNLVDNVFGRCTAGLQKALDKVSSNSTVAYLYQECRSGNASLVVAHEDGAVCAAMVVRFENWNGKSVLHTLGLWCAVKGTYDMMKQKQIELASIGGATSLVSGARVSKRGLCGYMRRHPTAKLLFVTLEVDLEDAKRR